MRKAWRRTLLSTALGAVLLVASARPVSAEAALEIMTPAGGSTLGGTVAVTAGAPSDTTAVAFAWSADGTSWTPVATDTDPLGGWGASWNTVPFDGPATLRATAVRSAGEETTTTSVVLQNAPRVTTGVSAARFSPNGDGRLETVTISTSLNEPGSIGIRILDAAGTLKRAWTSTLSAAGSYAVVWNGRTAGGTRLADGAYAVRAVATDASGNTTTVARSVTIDTIKPAVVWSKISPDPSSGSVTETFAFSVRDADWIFTGGLGVYDTVARIGTVRSLSLTSRSASLSWRPPWTLNPGTYRTRVILTDRAGNRSLVAIKPWRVHRSVTGRVITRVATTKRWVALTFDDCYEADAWRKILDVLRARNLKASFFCPGETLSGRASLARRTVSAGHSVGSHGWDHSNLAGRSDSYIRSRLLADREAWWRYGGATSAPYFRPPYGAYDARVLRISGETSMPRVMMWDVDPRDWTRPGTSVLVSRVAGNARPGSVVLLHTNGPTATALPRILDALLAKGLTPVSLDTLFRLG